MSGVHDETLGDTLYYTKRILANPPIKPKYLKVFKEVYGGDISNKAELKEFFRSEEYLTLVEEDDYNLFAERTLKYTVKYHHLQWTKDFLDNQFCIVLAPREHGKTAWLAGYVIWNAFYAKKNNILVVSETLGQAKLILGGEFSIKEQIESNPRLQDIYPTDYNRKWSETQIRLKNGVRVEVAGFGQKLRGRHPDLIILDDVLSDQNSGTREMRKKVFHYYSHVMVPMMKKNTQIILIGTAHHPEDLLFTLAGTGKYSFTKYQAVNEDTGEVLWPEKHTFESLQEFRRSHGELAYQREYQNNPLSDSLSFFPQDLLDSCKDSSLSYVPGYAGPNLISLGGDLSPPGGSKSGDGDYTVFSVVENNQEEVITLLNYLRFRDKPDSNDHFIEKQMDSLVHLCVSYDVDNGFIEEVGFQALYTKEIIRRQSNLPIKGLNVTHSGKKSLSSGIPYIRSLMEKGRFKLPYKTEADRKKTDELCREFVGVIQDDKGRIGNMSYHDDIVVSIWMAVEASKTAAKPMYKIAYDRYARKSNKLHIPRFKLNRRPIGRGR